MECQVIADDAQADLAVAMPALEKAMMEVDKLDKTSITEVGTCFYRPFCVSKGHALCSSRSASLSAPFLVVFDVAYVHDGC